MKVLLINSSPQQRESSTYRLAQEMLNQLSANAGMNVVDVSLEEVDAQCCLILIVLMRQHYVHLTLNMMKAWEV